MFSTQAPLHPSRRKFYQDTASVFRVAHGKQASLETATGTICPSSDAKAIVACYTSFLQQYTDRIKHEDQRNSVEIASFTHIHAIWSLFEILAFCDAASYGHQLIQWLNHVDLRSLLMYDGQGIFNAAQPTAHADFWAYATMCTVRGRLDIVSQLFHVASQRPGGQEDRVLLQEAALVVGAHTQHGWAASLTRCEHKIAQTHARDALTPRILAILRICQGDNTALQAHAPQALDRIVAAIHYKQHHDTSTVQSLQDIYRVAQAAISQDPIGNHSDPLVAMLTGDIYTTIEKCARMDPWLAAHWMDMLDRVPLPATSNQQYHHITHKKRTMDTRSFFLIKYAKHLTTTAGHWMDALDYLVVCGIDGRDQINTVLQTLPMDLAWNAVHFCERNGLFDQRKQLCKNMAARLETTKQHDDAIQLYYRAGDYHTIDTLCGSLFRMYVADRSLPALENAAKLDHKGRVAQCYFCFYTMHHCHERGDITAAAKHFWKMMNMEDDAAVTEFMPIVLLEGMIFLETAPVTPDAQMIDNVSRKLDHATRASNTRGLALLQQYQLTTCDTANEPMSLQNVKKHLQDIYAVLIPTLPSSISIHSQ
ncbi:Nup85 nucleoporin-domain-containing protein [Gongronella butleri]|nr:Nup85 nucleoporin-domain-containing protein [Gongronella butleri]